MAWQTPITDRVLQDAIEVRQGIQNPKGAFRAEDWNRILGNEYHIQDLILEWKNILADINDLLKADDTSIPPTPISTTAKILSYYAKQRVMCLSAM